MLIIAAAAKKQNFSPGFSSGIYSQPRFLVEAGEIMDTLQTFDARKISRLLGVSAPLARKTRESFQNWVSEHTTENSREAALAYRGEVYRQLQFEDYAEAVLQYLQDSLRIVSGLYGLLRPFDLIKPYRLEMDTKLKTSNSKDLYEFWGTKLTDSINLEIASERHELLINLASGAYSRAIQFDQLDCHTVHIDFLQLVGGEPVRQPSPSRQARGKMIDFLAKRRASSLADIRDFNHGGYFIAYEDETRIVFHRAE